MSERSVKSCSCAACADDRQSMRWYLASLFRQLLESHVRGLQLACSLCSVVDKCGRGGLICFVSASLERNSIHRKKPLLLTPRLNCLADRFKRKRLLGDFLARLIKDPCSSSLSSELSRFELSRFCVPVHLLRLMFLVLPCLWVLQMGYGYLLSPDEIGQLHRFFCIESLSPNSNMLMTDFILDSINTAAGTWNDSTVRNEKLIDFEENNPHAICSTPPIRNWTMDN